MRRILVVDDDPQFSNVVKEYLTGEGFEVVLARDHESGRAQLAIARPDLVLLDLMLGEDDGFILGREIHRQAIPFVIVSARQEAADRIVALEMGAEDFVTKPFELRELRARIRVVLRRASVTPRSPTASLDDSQALYCFEGWRLDLIAGELTDPAGDRVDLTSAELMLLVAFARRPRRVLTRSQISEEILHKEWKSGDRSVDMLVLRLRNKIERDPNRTFIKTRRGVGYVFALRVSREA